MKVIATLVFVLQVSNPLATARTIWGENAWVNRHPVPVYLFKLIRVPFLFTTEYQVGCIMYFGGKATFHPVATSQVSWDDAFGKVDRTKNGPVTVNGQVRYTCSVGSNSWTNL